MAHTYIAHILGDCSRTRPIDEVEFLEIRFPGRNEAVWPLELGDGFKKDNVHELKLAEVPVLASLNVKLQKETFARPYVPRARLA